MKKTIFYIMFIALPLCAVSQTHPVLITQTELNELAASTEWTTIQQFCNNNLNTVVEPGWAGWDWRIAIENYSRAYQILKTSDPAKANNFAKKTIALMKAAARHHNMGGPSNTHSLSISAQFLGLGNGSQTTFTLPFAPLAGSTVQVYLEDIEEVAYTYNSNKIAVNRFDPILKISNTTGGANNYSSSDYRLAFRDGLDVHILTWPGTTHPANGAQYYVTYFKKNPAGPTPALAASNYTISGTSLTFNTAPAANKAVFVRMIGDGYEQTGNYMGGLNSVQPDGPGYQMRTFNPALAFGFDLLYNHPDLTTALKNEFVKVLNDQIDWYEKYGYENDGDLGNYFIRGLYTGIMFTAYGTDGANPKTAYLKTQSKTYTDRIFNKLTTNLPGGYGPQGQYTNGTITDILQIFTIYKNLTGDNLLSKLEWTDNVIPAIIHGTKPNRKHFYDGGDWDELPAAPLVDGTKSFLKYLPTHPSAPHARQLLTDVGATNIPAGTKTDYKTSFPLAFCGKVCGPVFTRSSWATSAVWASFAAGEIFMDHTHYDQGHFTIQKGADYLLMDAGGYGDYQTDPFHNTILIDDRGAGDLSTYPPGQGAWGFADNRITKFENTSAFTYSQADITRAYARHHDGLQNSVKLARRTFLFIRPQVVIIHDKIKTPNTAVKKIFNCNFSAVPTVSNGIYSMTKGTSKLFYKPVVPSNAAPVLSSIAGKDANYRNCKITVSGQANSNFLNVFEAVPSSASAMTPTTYIDIQNMEGVEIARQDSSWVALFSKTDTLINVDLLTYSYTKTGVHKHIVSDLNRNYEYEVTVHVGTNTVMDRQRFISSVQGVLTFSFNSSAGGTVSITKIGVGPPIPLASNEDLSNDRNTAYISSGQLQIHWYAQGPTKLDCKVFNINGKLITEFNQQIGPGTNKITRDVSSLQDGIYIIQIGDNYKKRSCKTIK